MENNNLVSLICPQCNAQLEINSTELKTNCKHCGTSILIKDFVTERRIDNEDKIVSLRKLAENSLKNRDWKKVSEYYEEICKISPTEENVRNLNIVNFFLGKTIFQKSLLDSFYTLPIKEHRNLLTEMLKHINSLKSQEISKANTISDPKTKNATISSIHAKYQRDIQLIVTEQKKLTPIKCSCGAEIQYNEDTCANCGKTKAANLADESLKQKKKNQKTIIICAIVAVLLVIFYLVMPKVEENEPMPEETILSSTLTEPTEHGTSQYVDYIYYKAKEDAKTATDEDLQNALTWLKNNSENYFLNQEYMESTMYYGELLEMKYKDTGNEYEKLGWQAYKTIKYVYRGAESIQDETTQKNLSELKDMVSKAKNIK